MRRLGSRSMAICVADQIWRGDTSPQCRCGDTRDCGRSGRLRCRHSRRGHRPGSGRAGLRASLARRPAVSEARRPVRCAAATANPPDGPPGPPAWRGERAAPAVAVRRSASAGPPERREDLERGPSVLTSHGSNSRAPLKLVTSRPRRQGRLQGRVPRDCAGLVAAVPGYAAGAVPLANSGKQRAGSPRNRSPPSGRQRVRLCCSHHCARRRGAWPSGGGVSSRM